VAIREMYRLQTRVLAIDLRLAELEAEMQRTQIRAHHLEAELEDARMAYMMGEEAPDRAQLGSELEQSQNVLESQREMIALVKDNRSKARAALMIARVKEKRDARSRAESAGPGAPE